MKHGIDISKWQGAADWDKLAAQHKAGRAGAQRNGRAGTSTREDGGSLDFVIIRAGYGGGTIDPRFEEYYAAARAAGIPLGAYWYAYWGKYTPAQEAASFLRAVEGKTFEYGLWYDVEYEPDILALGKAERTDKTLEGLAALAASGRYVGLYASTDMINNRMEYARLRDYDIWVAQYANRCTCKLPFGIWQYTSSGSVPGIAGRVDCDRAYKDYPAFVTGSLAGEAAGAADKPAAEPLPPPAPGQEETGPETGGQPDTFPVEDGGPRLPKETFTRRYGPMTRGDLLRMLKTADGLGLYTLGELTIGPASSGDDAALCTLAEELGLEQRAAG